MAELVIRVLYQHKSNKVFYVNGVAKDENKREVVIITDISNGSVHTRPLSMFTGDSPSFVVVTPSINT